MINIYSFLFGKLCQEAAEKAAGHPWLFYKVRHHCRVKSVLLQVQKERRRKRRFCPELKARAAGGGDGGGGVEGA